MASGNRGNGEHKPLVRQASGILSCFLTTAVLLANWAGDVWAQSLPPDLDPRSAEPGTVVTVLSLNFPTDTKADKVALCPQTQQDCAAGTEVGFDQPAAGSLRFVVPQGMAFGKYRVEIGLSPSGKRLPTRSPLIVVPPPITLSTSPLLVYPEADGSYTVTLTGSGLGQDSYNDRRLMLDGLSLLDCVAPAVGAPAASHGAQPCMGEPARNLGQQQIQFAKLNNVPSGAHQVQLTMGGLRTSDPVSITFSAWGPSAPRIFASVSLAAIVIILVFLGFGRSTDLRTGARAGYLKRLLLDEDTQTLSLSRLQFYVWFLAITYAYAYLCVSHSLVQGHLELSDVPANLVGVLLTVVGASTAVAAIDNTKGTKGAGEIAPRISDLITTGGVVAPERLLHLSWTLLGAGYFVFLVSMLPPASISALPEIPTGFLELAGLSAVSYTAGRAMRLTGPRIDGIAGTRTAAAAPAPARIDFTIKGAGLSKNASFQVNDVDVAATNVAITNSVQDDSSSDTTMAKSLDVRIIDPQGILPQPQAQPITKPGEPNAPGHNFVIINPDGQRAVWKY